MNSLNDIKYNLTIFRSFFTNNFITSFFLNGLVFSEKEKKKRIVK